MRWDGKGCAIALLAIPAFGVIMAVVMIVAGLLQAPGASADATAYAADAGCTRFATNGASGASRLCADTSAVAVAVLPRVHTKNVGDGLDHVHLRFANGDGSDIALAAVPATTSFMHSLYPGEAVRVQLFRGAPAWLAAHGLAAETGESPAQRAASARTLPLAGAAILAVLALLALYGRYLYRRVAAQSRAT